MPKKTVRRTATRPTTKKKPTPQRSAKRAPAKKPRALAPERAVAAEHIPQDRFNLLSAAILTVVPKSTEGVPFDDVPRRVEDALSTKERRAIGSIGTHVTAIKLDLEARRRIEHVPGSDPLRVRRIR